jgi:hypothetical protein
MRIVFKPLSMAVPPSGGCETAGRLSKTDGMRLRNAFTLLLAALAVCLSTAAPARASEIVGLSTSHWSLKVDSHNRALVSYRAAGRTRHTLWWGAINAKFPDPLHPQSQYSFKRDYSGGSGSFGAGYWRRMRNVCGPYTGPPLPLVVRACTMPGGDHWVLQNWRRRMPNGGWPCCPAGGHQGDRELRISHFSGQLPELWLKWTYSKRFTYFNGKHLEMLYGRYSYKGRGMYGFSSTSSGAPTDSFGILIWVDTYNSSWGKGWRRVNSFLTHRHSDGAFCDQLWQNRFGRYHSPGLGSRYRAFADGTNPLPVVRWQGPPPGGYPVSEVQTRAGIGDYTLIDWLRHPFDLGLATALTNEQLIVSQGDDMTRSSCKFT